MNLIHPKNINIRLFSYILDRGKSIWIHKLYDNIIFQLYFQIARPQGSTINARQSNVSGSE